jgi:hypothetical protein
LNGKRRKAGQAFLTTATVHLGDDAGTYACKIGAKKDGTITAMHWHMVGVRNPAIEKTYECTKIPNIRGSQEWPLVNQGHMICFRHGAHCCVHHNVMIDRIAAEFGLDPTEVALKNDGRGHDWEWVTRYQKTMDFRSDGAKGSQRQREGGDRLG